MRINGFQKLTLLDYPGKVACTIFTAGCNFRCPFCHNASLVTHIDDSAPIEAEEVLSYLKKRQGMLEGVCITGGEPLLQPDLAEFISKIKEMGYSVKLDTNGSKPQELKQLVKDGLIDYVAMDIKNCKEKYGQTAGIENFMLKDIEESVAFLLSGAVDFEFRTTVVKEYHTPQDIEKISQWIKGKEKYFLQNFVDSGDIICDGLHSIEPDVISNMKLSALHFVPKTEIRGK